MSRTQPGEDLSLSSAASGFEAGVASKSLPLPCLSACSLSTRSAKTADSEVTPFPIEMLPPSVLALIFQGNCEELVRFCSANHEFKDVVCAESTEMQSVWNYALDVRKWNHLEGAMGEYCKPRGEKEVFVRLCKIEPRLPSGWAANFHVTQVAMLLAALEHDNVPVTTKGYLIESTDLAVASLCRLESSGKLLSWPTEGAPAGMDPCTFEATFADPSLFESLCRGIPNGNQQRTIAASAFQGHRSLNLKVLPDSITQIEYRAFFMCSNLSLMRLPACLNSIGASAFRLCKKLSVQHLPEGLETIGAAAFKDCSSLRLESLPGRLNQIHDEAFQNCRLLALTDISHVGFLGKRAFSGCLRLHTLKFNRALNAIPEALLEQCVDLTTVSLPPHLKCIGDDAFANCASLRLESLPDGVCALNARCFANCNELSLERLPESLTEIREEAFWNCRRLRLTNAASVRVLGKGVFFNCQSLQHVQLNKSLSTIPPKLFQSCVNLRTVSLPLCLESIGEAAFAACGVIDFESLPSGVSLVSRKCFAECKKLSLQSLPSGVTKIPESAFAHCYMLRLTDMTNVRVLGEGAFRYCEGLQTLRLSCELQSIPKEAFFHCINLTAVSLPQTLRTIQTKAFAYCVALKDLALPSALEFIGKGAFFACRSLRITKLPDDLRVIGDAAFGRDVWVDQEELQRFWDRTSSQPENEGRTIEDLTKDN